MIIIPVYFSRPPGNMGTILNNPLAIMRSLFAHVSLAALLLGWALFTALPN